MCQKSTTFKCRGSWYPEKLHNNTHTLNEQAFFTLFNFHSASRRMNNKVSQYNLRVVQSLDVCYSIQFPDGLKVIRIGPAKDKLNVQPFQSLVTGICKRLRPLFVQKEHFIFEIHTTHPNWRCHPTWALCSIQMTCRS